MPLPVESNELSIELTINRYKITFAVELKRVHDLTLLGAIIDTTLKLVQTYQYRISI